jgi:predicted ester cyclase
MNMALTWRDAPHFHRRITMTVEQSAPPLSSSTSNPMVEQDKAAAVRFLEEVFPANDESAVLAVLDENFVNHEAPPGTPPGPGGAIMFMKMLAGAFSDQRWTIHQVIAEGETVAIHCTHSGRHTGDFFGVPATGRSFAYKQMHMIKMRNGKGIEHWAVRDDATLMRQLTGTLESRQH